jgi:hypothetical protein
MSCLPFFVGAVFGVSPPTLVVIAPEQHEQRHQKKN